MKPFGILCLLLLLNPGARGEHLTSQLSWVAAWLLVTCFCLFYLVYMYLKGFICHWERGELGKVGEYWAVKVWKVYEWSEVARWQRWENSEVAQSDRREGSKVSIWERWDRGIERWHGKKDGRVARCQGGRFAVLFKGGRRRVRPRFHLFVSDANQQNERAWCVQDILARLQEWKDSPWI